MGSPRQRADHRSNVGIKAEVAGRTLFLGRERNKRSRKYKVKFLAPAPIDVDAAVRENERRKAAANEPAATTAVPQSADLPGVPEAQPGSGAPGPHLSLPVAGTDRSAGPGTRT